MNCPDCGRPMVEEPIDLTLGIGWKISCRPCGQEIVGRSQDEARRLALASEADVKEKK